MLFINPLPSHYLNVKKTIFPLISKDGPNVLTVKHSLVCIHIQYLKSHFKHLVT